MRAERLVRDPVIDRAREQAEVDRRRTFQELSDRFSEAIGGITGAGLEKNILDGYHYLAQTYEDGDEVFLLAASEHIRTALTDAFAQPFAVLDRELHIGGSVGVALYPRDGSTPDKLLRVADQSMYATKRRHKARRTGAPEAPAADAD